MTSQPLNYPPVSRGTLVLWSTLATYPFGGMTWHRLHYLVTLRRLGFDVWYVEDSDRSLYDPATFWPTEDYAPHLRYLAAQLEKVGLGDRWIFRPPRHRDFCHGARDIAGLKSLYREADAVINHTGAQELRPEHDIIRCKIYVETDPVAKQVEVANGNERTTRYLAAHDYLFTYGENIGTPHCTVPVEHFTWHPTRVPICLDWWDNPLVPAADAALTTIANWKHKTKNVPSWQGQRYQWSKHEQFLRFLELPARASLPLEVALGPVGKAETFDLFHEHGWRTLAAKTIAEPERYRQYIWESLGEFTVAKSQYVLPHSGWFSDRSACFLAAGRPVITQDTGFGNVLPTGRGLFAFSEPEDALAAIDAVAGDYDAHARAAREIAREYFDGRRVLSSLLQRAGLL